MGAWVGEGCGGLAAGRMGRGMARRLSGWVRGRVGGSAREMGVVSGRACACVLVGRVRVRRARSERGYGGSWCVSVSCGGGGKLMGGCEAMGKAGRRVRG